MDYWYEKETPANTVKNKYKTMRLKLNEGIIKKVWLFHPNGCRGLAYATINHGKHQLYPHNPEGAYHGDGVPMDFPDNYYLAAPALLSLHTWNLDDTYPHTVYVRLTVLRGKPDPMTQVLSDLVKIMKRMMGVK